MKRSKTKVIAARRQKSTKRFLETSAKAKKKREQEARDFDREMDALEPTNDGVL